MNAQVDWLSQHHARRVDPSTSKAAATSVKSAAQSLCDRILASLKFQGAATQTDIAKRLGIDSHQANKRLSDLKNAQMIVPSGLTRPGPSGRQQTVWRIATESSAAATVVPSDQRGGSAATDADDIKPASGPDVTSLQGTQS